MIYESHHHASLVYIQGPVIVLMLCGFVYIKMNSSLTVIVVLLLQSTAIVSKTCQWSDEAEHGNTNGEIIHRGGASNKQTVRLNTGQYISWGFVTDSSCRLQVSNVVYTNDGVSDTITVYVDSQGVGSFNTSESNHGYSWSESVSSGPIGDEIQLSSGDHTIKLVAIAEVDEYSVEIDIITLRMSCELSDSEGSCPKLDDANEPWTRGQIIGLVFGITTFVITLLSIIISIICSCKNGCCCGCG